MRTIKKSMAAPLILLSGMVTAAQAQMPDLSSLSVTVGAKVWSTTWSTWFFSNVGDPISNQAPVFDTYRNVFNRESPSEATFIPQITVRSGPWLVSASALAKREFTFHLNDDLDGNQQLDESRFERKEYDVNFGYAIAPSLAVTLGYKQLEYQGGGYRYKARGPTLGVSGSAPLTPMVSMYGSLAYGRPRISEGLASQKRGTYFLSEIGLAFPLGQMNDALKSVVVTAGYRYQKLTSDSVTITSTILSTGQVIGSREVDLVDTTSGVTVGVSATF